MPEAQDTSLIDAVAAFLAAPEGDPAQLADALRSATLYCIRPEKPGFVTGDPPWSQFIALFSSLDVMATALRAPTKWFSAPGAELAVFVPDGYNFVLDPGTDHALKINPAMLLPEPKEDNDE